MTNKPNTNLAWQILDHIDAHPDQWDQSHWWKTTRCGTTGCFAGWALALSGVEPIIDDAELGEHGSAFSDRVQRPDDTIAFIDNAACDLLGIEGDEGFDLFRGANTREDLGRLVVDMFGPRPGDPA